MVPLSNRDVDRVRHLFDADHLSLVIDAVRAGNSPARVWVDAVTAPRAALVWDGSHSVYFAGAVDRAGEWRALFGREVASVGAGILKAYVTDAAAETVLAGYPLQRRERVLYRGGHPAIPDWRRRLPAGFQVNLIDDRVTEVGALANATEVVAEIESCWKSLADFRGHGFGFIAHDRQAIVCWCTAEFVSDGKCGIGIATIPAYRGRGYATLTASAFMEYCAERAMTPHWDAWTNNRPSVAVAEKAGFQRIETYGIYVGDLGDIARAASGFAVEGHG
jgi:RimJ/RimL family protein N-acetyltransferase